MMRSLVFVLSVVTVLQPAVAQFPIRLDFVDEAFEFNRDDPLAGRWLGQFEVRGTPFVIVELLVDPAGDGERGTEVSVLQIGLVGERAVEFKQDGRAAELAFHRHWEDRIEAEKVVTMSVEVSEDGQWLEGDGSINAGIAPEEAMSGRFRLKRLPRMAELEDVMAFSGALKQTEGEMPMVIVMGRTMKGNWLGLANVTLNGVNADMPVFNLRRRENDITAQIPLGSTPVDLKVSLVENEQKMVGTVGQHAWSTEVEFRRDEEFVAALKGDALQADGGQGEADRHDDDGD